MATLGYANPFRYRGYYYDTETGYYYLNSRYYDPTTGRFLNPEPNVDSGGFDSGAGLLGYNVYAYCKNNPVNFVDFTGEWTVSVFTLNDNQLNKLEFELEQRIENINKARSKVDFVVGLGSAVAGFYVTLSPIVSAVTGFVIPKVCGLIPTYKDELLKITKMISQMQSRQIDDVKYCYRVMTLVGSHNNQIRIDFQRERTEKMYLDGKTRTVTYYSTIGTFYIDTMYLNLLYDFENKATSVYKTEYGWGHVLFR